MLKRTSSKTSTTNNNITSTTDARVAADNGAIVNRDGDIQVTDGGAITMAGEVSEHAIDAGVLFGEMGREMADRSFQLASDSIDTTVEALQAVIDHKDDDTAQLSEQLIKMIPFGIAGLVVWSILK